MIRKHIIFSGCVQGVGFRWRARKAAEMYGVTGLVREKLISVKEAAKRAGLTEEEFAKRTGLKRSIKHKRVFYRGNCDIIDCTRC